MNFCNPAFVVAAPSALTGIMILQKPEALSAMCGLALRILMLLASSLVCHLIFQSLRKPWELFLSRLILFPGQTLEFQICLVVFVFYEN